MGKSDKVKPSRANEIDDLSSDLTTKNLGSKSDQKITKKLEALSKKNKLRLIATSFFDTKSHKDLTHVVVSTSGIFLINAEDYEGLVEVRISSSIMRSATFQFIVGTEDKTDLIKDIRDRVRNAEEILNNSSLENKMIIRGVLALPYAQWPLFGRDNKIGGILLKGDEVYSIFTNLGKYTQEEVDSTYNILIASLN